MGTVSLHVPGIKIISSKVTLSMNIVGSDIMMPMDIQGSYIMVPMDIQAQYMNLAIDIVAQTVGNIKMDIAAQSVGKIGISVNVADIVGNLPMDIKAQTIGNLAIDIAAQTIGNINVNLAASAITLNVQVQNATINVNVQGTANISITGQNVGVYLQPEWSAKQNIDKGLYGSSVINDSASATVIDYTVPTGKALYVNNVGLHIYNYGAGSTFRFFAQLRDASLPRFYMGGEVGGAWQMNKPIKFTAGQHAQLSIGNISTQQFYVAGIITGYEVEE